jgi:hypothetical protein
VPLFPPKRQYARTLTFSLIVWCAAAGKHSMSNDGLVKLIAKELRKQKIL